MGGKEQTFIDNPFIKSCSNLQKLTYAQTDVDSFAISYITSNPPL